MVVLMKFVFSLRTVGMSRETTKSGMKYTQEERLKIKCEFFLCCIQIDPSDEKKRGVFL
jgi:hypothetical protein